MAATWILTQGSWRALELRFRLLGGCRARVEEVFGLTHQPSEAWVLGLGFR